jgi:predicted nucleotidyltransferase
MVFYRLSTGDPLIKQMKIMFNVWSLRKLMEEIKEKTKKIILFGSCAEGTDAKKSDIDLLIITDQKGPVKESLSRFNRKSDKKIAPLILDMNEFVKMKKEDRPFYERIDRGIVLWENL